MNHKIVRATYTGRDGELVENGILVFEGDDRILSFVDEDSLEDVVEIETICQFESEAL